jgi:hypothetical protein
MSDHLTTPVAFMTIAIQFPGAFKDKEFATYEEFQRFHMAETDSSHYEVIRGKQCLYFDFDGDVDLQELKNAIIQKVGDKPIRIDVYSSSDKTKKSYHVVVKGIYFIDHLHCGHFAKEIISATDITSFDMSVYSDRRNMRLLFSRKLNSTRRKIHNCVLYRHNNFSHSYEDDPLRLSLIIDIIDCELMETGFVKKPVRVTSEQLDEHDVQEGLNFVQNFYPNVFERREVKDGSIFLKRLRPYMCSICKRIHQNENAIVSRYNRKWYFKCLRKPDESRVLEDETECITIQLDPRCLIETNIKQPVYIPKRLRTAPQENLDMPRSSTADCLILSESSDNQPARIVQAENTRLSLVVMSPLEELAEMIKNKYPIIGRSRTSL